jgi:hypothetical protein
MVIDVDHLTIFSHFKSARKTNCSVSISGPVRSARFRRLSLAVSASMNTANQQKYIKRIPPGNTTTTFTKWNVTKSMQRNVEMTAHYTRNNHCCEEDLELYLTGGLPCRKTPVLKAHLDNCTPCMARLSAANVFLSQMARLSNNPGIQDERTTLRRLLVTLKAGAQAQVL